MHDLQIRRQIGPEQQRTITIMTQFFDHRIFLSAQPEQQPHAEFSPEPVSKPLNQWRSFCQSTEIHPCHNIAESLCGVWQSQSRFDIRAAFAQPNQNQLARLLLFPQPIKDHSAIPLQRPEAIDRNNFHCAACFLNELSHAPAVRAGILVVTMEGAGNNADEN
ncbi:MAG TPA: hypothetical protein VFW05_18835 [Verrucomicrobiae bacterium]|nr:hypothetical protein [Verrucomicrobiae bacterium]